MSDIINLLPDSVANQIAAGEVIQRPASVVKELMENSIDAGATLIKLIIKDAGNTLIQVVDDGKGMSVTDARMSFERHATSKIKEAEDLFSLRTMGFRGEALASIASVAQVEMKTRREEDELGTFLEIAGSRVFKQEPIQTDKGTNIAVKSLFFNVPARRRFLKSPTTEMMHIRNEFYRIVLVHPEIQFELFEDDRETILLNASNLKIRIESVFNRLSKRKVEQQLLPIKNESQLLNITGFVGRPEFAQKNAQQYFFVNNRYMRHPYFHKAVTLAYDNLLKQGENPNYFIYFDINPELIDVNIHPTKTEIKFEDEKAVWTILHATVKEVLGKFQIAPSLDFDREEMPDIPVLKQGTQVSQPKTNFNPSYNPFKSTTATPTTPKVDFNWDKLYNDFTADNQQQEEGLNDFQTIESNADVDTQTHFDLSEEKKDFFQLKRTYIITNVKSGLMLIHQHRAHFRVLFDRLLEKSSSSQKTSQQVLFPETLELDVNERERLLELLPKLENVGFELQQEAENDFTINGVPAEFEVSSAIPLLKDIIAETEEIELDAEEVLKEKIAYILAKKSAIETGKTLTNEEMSKLIEELFSCQNHTYTPDGKTIISLIGMNEITRLFA